MRNFHALEGHPLPGKERVVINWLVDYWKVALLIAALLAGMAAGAVAIINHENKKEEEVSSKAGSLGVKVADIKKMQNQDIWVVLSEDGRVAVIVRDGLTGMLRILTPIPVGQ